MQRILIITACTAKKRIHCKEALTLTDFRAGASHIAQREKELSSMLMPAEELYTGLQQTRLMRGIDQLGTRCFLKGEDLGVDLWILSAGYGLVAGKRVLAPYECTFAQMKKADRRAWADTLQIPSEMRYLLAQRYSLGLILLGESYLDACALDENVQLGGPTFVFCGSKATTVLPSLPHLRIIPLAIQEARAFSCSMVGLKGEVAARLLMRIAENGSIVEQLADAAVDPLSFCHPTPID